MESETNIHSSSQIGFRGRKKEADIQQASNVPWEHFSGIFAKCHWHFPPAETSDGREDYDQELENEYSGDGTWLQLATGADQDAEATDVHALLVEVCNLTRDELLSRLQGITALGHTLYRHRPDEPEWRLIIPFAEPVTVAIADAVHRKFFADKMIGGLCSNEEEQARWFLRPGCRDDLREFFDHFKIDGHFIDAEAVLSGAQNWDGTATLPTLPSSIPPEATAIISSPLAHLSDQELRSELEVVNASLTTPEDFAAVAEKIMELEFELDCRQKWAPANRPSFPIPHRRSDLKPAHKLIQQARVIVDCHWLHMQCKKRQVVKEARWQALLDPTSEFPLALAEDFARRAIAGAERAGEILCLTPLQQAQTRTMCGKRMADARKRAEDTKPTGRSAIAQSLSAINQWAATDPRVQAEKYAALVRAMCMLDGSTHTNTDLGLLIGFTLGETPVQENQIRGMKDRLATAVKRYS